MLAINVGDTAINTHGFLTFYEVIKFAVTSVSKS